MSREISNIVFDERLFDKVNRYCEGNEAEINDFIVDAVRMKIDLLMYGDLNEKINREPSVIEKIEKKEEKEVVEEVAENTEEVAENSAENVEEVAENSAENVEEVAEKVAEEQPKRNKRSLTTKR